MDKSTFSTPAAAPIPFIENAAYTVEQAAVIIQRCPKTVLRLCKRGEIPARCDRGGYRITGWMIRAYLECRISTDNPNVK